MKKYLPVVAAACVAASLSAQAASSSDTDPFALSIPNLKGGVEMNVGGMLAKPNSSASNNSSAASDSAQASPGVNSGVGYSIPGSGNDVQVQWNSNG